MSSPVKITPQLETICQLGVRMAQDQGIDSLLLLLDGPTDWARLRTLANHERLLIAADREEDVVGAKEAGLPTVVLHMSDTPVYEKLTQALLECVADELLEPGASVVVLYSGFEVGTIDSISLVRLDEHLGRLTVRDLR